MKAEMDLGPTRVGEKLEKGKGRKKSGGERKAEDRRDLTHTTPFSVLDSAAVNDM